MGSDEEDEFVGKGILKDFHKPEQFVERQTRPATPGT